MEEYRKSSKSFSRAIYSLAELKNKAPKFFGIPTGTKLDEMFYKVETENGTLVRKPLGGVPYLGVLNIVGVPDTGKSILAEQFAIFQASLGYNVLFVTSETPAEFLYNALKARAFAMDIDFDNTEEKIIVIDATADDSLRENIYSLVKTMEYAINKKKTTVTVIDSITGFYEHREMLARQIVRVVYNFLKKKHQTALLVSQKRSSQGAETAEAAGGLAVAHILDGTIVLDKKLIMTKYDTQLYKLPLGTVLRTIRIDGCRLSAHDQETHIMEITETGLVEIGPSLREWLQRQ